MTESAVRAIEAIQAAQAQLHGELAKVFNMAGLRGQRVDLMLTDVVRATDVLSQLRALEYLARVTESVSTPAVSPEVLARLEALEKISAELSTGVADLATEVLALKTPGKKK
jgi:hypothetical protein